jgi:hypothetical protein
MIYVKVDGRYKTLKEIAIENNLPVKLVMGRHQSGKRDLAELIKPKWYFQKEEANESFVD